MNKTVVRIDQINKSDIDGLVMLEKEVWGELMGAEEQIWASRISTYPKGTFVAKADGKVVGVLVLHRLKWIYNDNEFPTWNEVTANGYITNHDDEGEVLYGVNMTVMSGYPGVASEFIQRAIILKNKEKISRGLLGGRIPILAAYAKKHGLNQDSLDSKMVLEIAKIDMLVKFFCSNHFRVIAAKKDYYPIDEASLGWGIILEVTK